MAATITTAYSNALKEGLRESRAYIHNLNKGVFITDDAELVSFKIYSELQRENNIFGNTVAKYAEIEVKNIDNLQFNDWLDNSIEIYLGLSIDAVPEYIKQGIFRVYNIEFNRDKQTAKLECYDSMVRFNASYKNSNAVFPMSLGNFFAKIVGEVGLEVGSTTFPNSTFMIAQPNVGPDEFTYRNLLGWIAELAGGNAVIGRDGKVYIQTFGDIPVYAIDADEYFTLEIQDTYGPIQKVRMIREFEDIVEHPAGDLISYDIIDNQLAYDQRESIIQGIHAQINGIQYTPFKLTYRGTGHLDFCDLIQIVNSNNQTFNSYVMNHTLTFDGSMSEELSAIAYSPASESIKSDGEIKKKTSFTSARVDKVENQITLIASDIETLEGQVSSNTAQLSIQAGQIATKVEQSTFNTLSGRVDTAESSITQQAGQIALRVTESVYNAGIASKENTVFKQNTAPAHLDGRLWLNTSVTPNVLNRSNGTAWIKATPTQASEVGAYSSSDGTALANRVTNAETSITQQAGQIALKADQTTVNAVSAVANSKARTFLSTPTTPYYVGDIWIETNATTGGNRVCTTQRLTGAYVAGDWTKEGVTSRMDSAELRITPAAITSTVRSSSEYTADQNAKENTVFKQTTAPTHLNGRLWLDISITPNILYRSNGSAWIKATPTQASEVGAYSSSQGTALEGSLNTAVSINEMTKKNGIELFDQRYVTDITKPPTTVSSGAQSIEPSTVVGLSDNRNIIKTTHSTWLRSDFIPYIQGNPVYMSCKVYNEATSNGILYVGLEFYDSAKVSLGSNDLVIYAIIASSTSIPINTWVDLNGFVTPTGSDRAKASFVRVRILTRWSGNQGITYLSHVSVKQLGYNSDAQTFERLTTAESSIVQNANQIALRVTESVYNAGIASKENTVIKQTTAPAHLDGRLWLNTSVTPNVLNRSNGTAWVKATPTLPSEVGAYSNSDGTALAGRVSTAESSITQQAGQIATKVEQSTFDTLSDRVDIAETSIVQTANGIRTEVSNTYTSKGELDEYKSQVSTRFTQTSNEYTMLFSQINEHIQTLDGETQAQFNELVKYIRFINGNIELGEINNPIKLILQNNRISFTQNGTEVAYISDNILYITDGRFLNSLRIGNFAFTPRSNGSLSFGRVI